MSVQEFLTFLENWQHLWIFIGSIGTAVLAGLLARQIWIQNRTVKLAYMPSIIPRQSQTNEIFTLLQIENVGNGTAKFVSVTLTNLSSGDSRNVTALGLISRQVLDLPTDKRLEGKIGDKIKIEAKFKDISGTSHTQKDKVEISKIFSVD